MAGYDKAFIVRNYFNALSGALFGNTISGVSISTSGKILSAGVDLSQLFASQYSAASWTAAYTTLTSNSASWNNTTIIVIANSANWNSAYTTLTANSAIWNNTTSTVNTNSANWNSSYTIVNTSSANWGSAYTTLTLNSANWNNTTSTVNTNSANWNASYTTLTANSANWNAGGGNTAVNAAVTANSANWNASYTTLTANSASWGSGSGNTAVNAAVTANSANWNASYTTLTANSAAWGSGSGNTAVNAAVTANSANWNASYTTLTANSANWNAGGGNTAVNAVVTANSANWNASYTTLTANSANWNEAYATVTANSANWNAGGGNTAVNAAVTENSANWNASYTTLTTNSARYILDGGNATAATLTAGTRNNNSVIIMANNMPRIACLPTGGVQVSHRSAGTFPTAGAGFESCLAVKAAGATPFVFRVERSDNTNTLASIVQDTVSSASYAGRLSLYHDSTERIKFAPALQSFILDNLSIGDSSGSRRLHVCSAAGGALNSVSPILRLDSRTIVGTPSAGIGTGIEFAVKSAASTLSSVVGASINAVATDLSTNAQKIDLSFNTMTLGSVASEKLRIKSTGAVNFVGLAVDPSGGAAGDVYFNSSETTLKFYDGVTWINLKEANTILTTNSANWDSTYATVAANSASWGAGGGNTSVDTLVTTNSARWNTAYTTLTTSSANWNTAYTTLTANSANYILDGGNTKGSALIIGTNDSQNLNLETNNTIRMSIKTSGAINLAPLVTAPVASLNAGDVYYNSVTRRLNAYDDSTAQWRTINSSRTIATFTAPQTQPVSANFATINTRSVDSLAVLTFTPGSPNKEARFVGVIPDGAPITANGLTIRAEFCTITATTGSCRWAAQIKKVSSASYATSAAVDVAITGTAGLTTMVATIPLTAYDSLAEGNTYALRIFRDSSNAADTMTGDSAQLVSVEVRTT